MKCTILHEGKGRMRVHVEKVRMTLHRADVLEAYLNHNDAIVHAAVYERTGDVVITYTGKRSAAIAVLAGYKFDVAEYDALVTSADSRRLNREYQDKMFDLVAGRCLRKLFLPAPLDAAYTAFRSIRFLWKGVRCVLSRRLEVEVLDALSIGVSMLRGDFSTAGSVMFLLRLGELLEGVAEDHRLSLCPQCVQKRFGAGHGVDLCNHILNFLQPQPMLLQNAQPPAHQLVIIRLVAGGAAQLRDAALLGKGDPYLGDKYSLHVKAYNVHFGCSFLG